MILALKSKNISNLEEVTWLCHLFRQAQHVAFGIFITITVDHYNHYIPSGLKGIYTNPSSR